MARKLPSLLEWGFCKTLRGNVRFLADYLEGGNRQIHFTSRIVCQGSVQSNNCKWYCWEHSRERQTLDRANHWWNRWQSTSPGHMSRQSNNISETLWYFFPRLYVLGFRFAFWTSRGSFSLESFTSSFIALNFVLCQVQMLKLVRSFRRISNYQSDFLAF